MPSTKTLEFCRYLRQHSTPAEEILWQHLRNKQLIGLKFRRQHPVSGFILDFYCPKLRLAIEVDGAIHQDPETRKYDQKRTRLLARNGIYVIRFWNDEVLNHLDSVPSRIQAHVDSLT